MPLDYDMLMALPPRVGHFSYTKRDTILYALGLGIGQQAVDNEAYLRFLYEEDLVPAPTYPVMLGYPGFWQREPQYKLDWRKILHAEQVLDVHKPIPPEGRIRAELVIDSIFDKGAEKGALLYARRNVFDEATGEKIVTVVQGMMLRGNGGFGGRRDGAPIPRETPKRAPDFTRVIPTRPEQALIYRLSGDYNPLHAVPSVAASAGFPKPILHGLATYGIAGFAAMDVLCPGGGFLKRLDCRFSSPVFPGETLSVAVWREGAGKASLEVRVQERDIVVLKNGYLEYDA